MSNLSDIYAENFTYKDCGWPMEKAYNVTLANNPTNYVELIIYPVLLFVCTSGNIISIVVLTTEVPKISTNVYLICLSISDLCVVWLALTFYISTFDSSVMENANYRKNITNFQGIQQWLQETCIQFSDWTLILFSLERLVVVAKPLNFRYRPSVRQVIFLELVVFLLAAICTLENVVMWYYVLSNGDGVRPKSKIAPPALLKWEAVQNEAEVVLTIGKLVLLIIINVLLTVILIRHNKSRQFSFSNSIARSPSQKSHRKITFVLLACVALYFFTQFPNVIFKVLEVASKPPHCSYNFTSVQQNSVRPFIYMIFLTNYSVNFLLYCLIWGKFRTQVKHLMKNIITCKELSTIATNSTGSDDNVVNLAVLRNRAGEAVT